MNMDTRPPGRWKPGQSGNPRGRPKGARNRATVMMERLMLEQAEVITRAVLSAAALGDMTAARMVLERLLPPARERPVRLELPDVQTAEGVAEAQGAILAAAAAGELLLAEAAALSGLVEARRRAIETLDHEERIAAMEARAPQ